MLQEFHASEPWWNFLEFGCNFMKLSAKHSEFLGAFENY
jgi:hypothetical protein